MGKVRNSKPRKMLPQFLVICEGETEEAYVNILKQNYRLPIKIVSKIAKNEVTKALVNRYKRELSNKAESVKTFFIYDGDIPVIVERLKECEGEVFISNPCVEIWFLAHFKDIPDVEISTAECLNRLKNLHNWKNYRKANFSLVQQNELWENRLTAVKKMTSISDRKKTYSDIYKFIEMLEKLSENRNQW